MTYNALRRYVAGLMVSLVLLLVSATTPVFAQTTGDTAAGQTMGQRNAQVVPEDDDDGMDLGWLGLLGLAGLLGLRRREEVHRVDTTSRTTRP